MAEVGRMVSLYNVRVDLYMDGVLQARPSTRFSHRINGPAGRRTRVRCSRRRTWIPKDTRPSEARPVRPGPSCASRSWAGTAVRNRAARKHGPTRSDRTRPNDDCHPDRILLEYTLRSLDDHCSGGVRTRRYLMSLTGERPLEDQGKPGELVGTDSEPASRQRLYSPTRKKGAGRIPSDACARCAATLAGV